MQTIEPTHELRKDADAIGAQCGAVSGPEGSGFSLTLFYDTREKVDAAHLAASNFAKVARARNGS